MENGTYRGRAISAALGKTSNGNEQVGIVFAFVNDNGELTGGTLTYYGTFTEKAFEHTLKAMRVAGWQGTNLDDLSSLSTDDTPIVDLVVKTEEYQGKPVTKIQWVNVAGGMGMKDQLDPTAAASFAQKMRSAVLAYDQKNAGAKKAAPRSAPRNGHPAGDPRPEPPPLTDDPPQF